MYIPTFRMIRIGAALMYVAMIPTVVVEIATRPWIVDGILF